MTETYNSGPMDDAAIVSRIDELKSRTSYEGTNALSAQRIQSTNAYTGGNVLGTEPTTGMSSVIDNKIRPAIEILSTYMTKIFASDKETVVFTPTNSQYSDAAKQAMMIANHVLHKSNNGYNFISRCTKDAAINKNSVAKLIWDDKPDSFVEHFSNVSEDELEPLILEREERGYEVEIESGKDGDYTLRFTRERSVPTIQLLPPEEFLINEGATEINRKHHLLRFCCHRKLMFLGDILEMFPKVDERDITSAATADQLEYEYETQSRHFIDGTYEYATRESSGPLAQLEVTDSWIYENIDGKGVDWWHIITVGASVVLKERWDDEIPFVSFCYFPITHKFYGLSVFDKVRDYFLNATGLLRSELDVRTRQNTTMIVADPRYINQQDLQMGRPGVIKASGGFDPSKVMVLPSPTGSPNTLDILRYLDEAIQAQIGINPLTGAISAEVEKSGNDDEKTSQIIDNASVKIEGYAREFAEQCLRPLIWQILRMMVQHSDDPAVQELVEQLTPGVPFLLAEDGLINEISMSDLTAKVGLGHMTNQQKLRGISAIAQAQMTLEQSGIMISPDKKVAVSNEIAKASGYENVQDFFPTPAEIQQEEQVKAALIQQATEQGRQMGIQEAVQAAEHEKIIAETELLKAKSVDLVADNKREDAKLQLETQLELMQQRPVAL